MRSYLLIDNTVFVTVTQCDCILPLIGRVRRKVQSNLHGGNLTAGWHKKNIPFWEGLTQTKVPTLMLTVATGLSQFPHQRSQPNTPTQKQKNLELQNRAGTCIHPSVNRRCNESSDARSLHAPGSQCCLELRRKRCNVLGTDHGVVRTANGVKASFAVGKVCPAAQVCA